jgi:hypothetical protein
VISRPGVTFTNIRMLRVARYIYEGGVVTAQWMMREFGVCWSTAKKDMQLVGMYLPVEILTPVPGRHDPRAKRLQLSKRSAR